MLVETYEMTECDIDGTPELESEALELIEKLGLDGQQSLVNPETKERSPYRKMTEEEFYVISRVCPTRTDIRKYADGPIPVRVLQVAAHAMDLFDRVIVMHPANADEKDPYLVGENGDEWNVRERFMLARWGDELLPWSQMVARAATKARDIITGEIRGYVAKMQARIAQLAEMSDSEIVATQAHAPSVYNLD